MKITKSDIWLGIGVFFAAFLLIMLLYILTTSTQKDSLTTTVYTIEKDIAKVETHFISYTYNEVKPNEHPIIDCANSWKPQVPVAIIGIQMTSFITTQGELSNGFIYSTIEVATVPERNASGRLGQLEARVTQRNGQVYGKGVESQTVMFPEKCRVLLEPDEPLYLHFFARNTMDRQHLASVGLLIYYVER
jgi:hypothetical protein